MRSVLASRAAAVAATAGDFFGDIRPVFGLEITINKRIFVFLEYMKQS